MKTLFRLLLLAAIAASTLSLSACGPKAQPGERDRQQAEKALESM